MVSVVHFLAVYCTFNRIVVPCIYPCLCSDENCLEPDVAVLCRTRMY